MRSKNSCPTIDFDGDTYTVWSVDGICLTWTTSLSKAARVYQAEIEATPPAMTYLYELQTA